MLLRLRSRIVLLVLAVALLLILSPSRSTARQQHNPNTVQPAYDIAFEVQASLDPSINWLGLDAQVAYGTRGNTYHFYDLSQPATPRNLGVFTPNGTVLGVHNQHLYQLLADNTIQVLDIRNPARPQVLGAADISPYFTRFVQTVGSRVYYQTTKMASSLSYVELANPAQPIQGSCCYVWGFYFTAQVIKDVVLFQKPSETNPGQLPPLEVYDVSGQSEGLMFEITEPGAGPFRIVDDMLYANSQAGPLVYDISDRSNPRRLDAPLPVWFQHVALLEHNLAFVGAGGVELQVYDARRNADPLAAPIASFQQPGTPFAFSGNLLLIHEPDQFPATGYQTRVALLSLLDPANAIFIPLSGVG